jgi:hypothetical protein
VARDFKEFIRLWQTSHVLTSPHYPQSNGKLERVHRTLKEQAIRPQTPLCLEAALRARRQFIDHYNTVRLHSGIAYVTPQDKLLGRDKAILQARDEKLQQARERRADRNAPHDECSNTTALRLIHNRPGPVRCSECLAQVRYVAAANRSGIRRLWVSRELKPLSSAAIRSVFLLHNPSLSSCLDLGP